MQIMNIKTNMATDIVVKTNNPEALDNILQSFGAVVVMSNLDKKTYLQKDGGYVVRCFSDAKFIQFVIKNQGYGEFVKVLDELV